MLPAAYRLRGDSNFKRILGRGRSLYTPIFKIRYVPNNLEVSRFAFVVSIKVSKKAVKRNQLKRRMRAIINSALLAVHKGFDIMIIARPQAMTLDFWQISKELTGLLKKARLINDSYTPPSS